MNKNKKIIIFSLIFVCLILVALIIFKNGNFSLKEPIISGDSISQKDFFEEYTFENREKLISQILAKKLEVAEEEVSASIVLESQDHLVGFYFVNSLNNSSQGKFFGVINKSINIVWFGADNINCEVLLKNNFSEEMAPTCF